MIISCILTLNETIWLEIKYILSPDASASAEPEAVDWSDPGPPPKYFNSAPGEVSYIYEHMVDVKMFILLT